MGYLDADCRGRYSCGHYWSPSGDKHGEKRWVSDGVFWGRRHGVVVTSFVLPRTIAVAGDRK